MHLIYQLAFSLLSHCDFLFLATCYFIYPAGNLQHPTIIVCFLLLVISYIPQDISYCPSATFFSFHTIPLTISFSAQVYFFSFPFYLIACLALFLSYFIPCLALLLSLPSSIFFPPSSISLLCHCLPSSIYFFDQLYFIPVSLFTHSISFIQDGNGTYTVCTVRHCFQGPCQGSLHILQSLQKAKLIWFDQKVRKNKVRVITPIRVHVMGHWENHHMTNFQKWSKNKVVGSNLKIR